MNDQRAILETAGRMTDDGRNGHRGGPRQCRPITDYAPDDPPTTSRTTTSLSTRA